MKRYDLSPLAVLLVEDNEQMRRLVMQMLRGFGFRDIVAVNDGEAALQVLDQTHIDMVVTDWAMRPVDGLDFVRRVRNAANCGYRMVPILMMSGYSEEWRVAAARDAGINEFLVKPISARRLLERIFYMIEHPRPFIRTTVYFGPDRRRKVRADHDGIERRQPKSATDDPPPDAQTISEAEVEALLRG